MTENVTLQGCLSNIYDQEGGRNVLLNLRDASFCLTLERVKATRDEANLTKTVVIFSGLLQQAYELSPDLCEVLPKDTQSAAIALARYFILDSGKN